MAEGEPGAFSFTAVEGEMQSFDNLDRMDSLIEEYGLHSMRADTDEQLDIKSELTKRGYTNVGDLIEIEDGELDQLCDSMDLRYGWRRKFKRAMKSLKLIDPTTPRGGPTPGGLLITSEQMSKPAMVERLLEISNLPFPREDIEKAVEEDTTGSLDEIVIHLFSNQKFDTKVVADETRDTYAPVRTRPEAQEIAKNLNDLEHPFRQREEFLEALQDSYDTALGKARALMNDKRPAIEEKLEEYKQLLLEEERKCEDDNYFHTLVISDKYSTKTKRFICIMTIYGQLHFLLMSDDEEAWLRDMDKIDAICEKVKARAAGQPKIVQPKNENGEFDLFELYLHSVVTQVMFEEKMRPLADGLDEGRFFTAGHKSLQRMLEKMAFHIKRRWQANIWDMVRVMISFDSLSQIAHALEKLMEMEDIEVFKVKNRFMREKEEQWQDVLIHLRFRDHPFPIICEMQFCLFKFTLARKDLAGHKLYSASRLTKEIRRFVDPTDERDPKLVGLRFKAAGLRFNSARLGNTDEEPEEIKEAPAEDEILAARLGNEEEPLELKLGGYEGFLNSACHPKYIVRDDDRMYQSQTNADFYDHTSGQDWLVFYLKPASIERKIPTKIVLKHNADESAPRTVCFDVFDPINGETPGQISSARKDDESWRQIGQWETDKKDDGVQEFEIERDVRNAQKKFRVRFLDNWGEDAKFVAKYSAVYFGLFGV